VRTRATERSPPLSSEISGLPVARHRCQASHHHTCPRPRPHAKLSSAYAHGSTHHRYIPTKCQLQNEGGGSMAGEESSALTFRRSWTRRANPRWKARAPFWPRVPPCLLRRCGAAWDQSLRSSRDRIEGGSRGDVFFLLFSVYYVICTVGRLPSFEL
jgi:hypothetical protein